MRTQTISKHLQEKLWLSSTATYENLFSSIWDNLMIFVGVTTIEDEKFAPFISAVGRDVEKVGEIINREAEKSFTENPSWTDCADFAVVTALIIAQELELP